MKDLKISDKLLNLVTGCKCKFNKIESNFIDFVVISGEIKEDISPYFYSGYDTNGINLHTFIHLAKVKAFECGYNVVEFGKQVCISRHGEYLKDFNVNPNGNDSYLIVDVIEALEWVAEKLDKK